MVAPQPVIKLMYLTFRDGGLVEVGPSGNSGGS
jgi:hypothetical protein